MLGAAAFFGTLLLLVLVHEYGHFLAARSLGIAVEEFGFGFPPALVRRSWRGTVYSLNLVPLGGFVRIHGEDGVARGPESFSARPASQRALVVAAGIVMNFLLAATLFTVGFAVGLPQDLTEPAPAGATVRDVRHEVFGVVPGSPAAGMLEDGDRITVIDGQPFQSLAELQGYIQAHHEQPLAVTVERRGVEEVVSLQPTLLGGPRGQTYALGVRLASTGSITYPFWRAPIAGVALTGRLSLLIATSFWGIIVNLVQGSPVGLDVAGPVGIAILTGQAVGLGAAYLLQFVALLSLNLAFVNLLPIPALDGGRLLFLAVEAVRGRPVSPAVEGQVHRWGFAVLLMTVLLVTYFDLQRFSGVLRF